MGMDPLLLCLLILASVWGVNVHEPNPKFLVAAAATATSTQSPPPASQCTCNTSTVWLDVVFLFDASKATGQNNLNNMWGFIASMLDFYTVQKSGYTGNNFYTQVGIVTYGNQATVFKPLGSIDLDDIDGIYSLPYSGDQLTNLEQGLITAKAQLDGSARRPNARQVIVAMAMTYNPSGVNAPEEEATTIKEDGVVIITYNYIPSHGGAPAQQLGGIATPGYFFMTGSNGTVDDMNQALCDANCFCPQSYAVYSTGSVRQLPTDGCYTNNHIGINQRLCINNCKQNNGTLATDKDANKTNFLATFSPDQGGTSFWIGLNFEQGRWQWPDETPLLATDYQPWAGGTSHDGSASQTGVYVTPQQTWQSTDPRSSYYCVCRLPACDSTNYCYSE